jgi:succinate dehydrogenase/fumarate reductase flavoprotein subunit
MKSSETLMLQDVWRQAFKKPDGLRITFASKRGAMRARMQLYNAVKLQKANKDTSDVELCKAAEELEIIWEGETILRLQRKDTNDAMQGISAALGKTMNDYVDPDIAESAERMLRSLQKDAPAVPEGFKHQDTPFYPKRG